MAEDRENNEKTWNGIQEPHTVTKKWRRRGGQHVVREIDKNIIDKMAH